MPAFPRLRLPAACRAAWLLLALGALGALPLAGAGAQGTAGGAAQGTVQGGQPKAQAGMDPAEARRMEAQAAWEAAVDAATPGPANVPLLDQATLRLPSGMIFIPQDQAARLLRASGNQPGADLVGLVTTTRDEDHWNVVIRYAGEGYIRDDDAKNWNADEILESLRQGTEEANKDRAQRGFPELELVGWIAPPHYDPATHQLVWSLLAQRKGSEADGGHRTVNYNTRALGRDGYFSLNLITDEGRIAADRAVANTLLGGMAYAEGKRYQDFTESTDRVAEYGLAGLIGVVAAKKLGLFALAAAFFAKFAKVIVFAAIGLGAAVMRLFRRKPAA